MDYLSKETKLDGLNLQLYMVPYFYTVWVQLKLKT